MPRETCHCGECQRCHRRAYFDSQDIADLARCAAAWAKVERSSNPMIERRNWPQGAKWYFGPGGRSTGSGPTAIAAVEAAQEVKL
jgi:hypothetical protein